MIENDLQYRVTQEQAARLEAGLTGMTASQPSVKGISPVLLEGAKSDVRYLLAKLYGEIAVYEAGRDSCEREPKRLPVWLRRSGWQTPAPRRDRAPVHAGHQRAPEGHVDLVRLLDRAEAELQTIVPSDIVREEVEAALWGVAGMPEDERRRLYDSLGDWAGAVQSLVDGQRD